MFDLLWMHSSHVSVLFVTYLWDTRNIAMASFGSILVEVGQTYIYRICS